MNGQSTGDTERIEITHDQRKRLDRIKEECTEGGQLPPPTDKLILDSLMDTWDAVDRGLYSGTDQEDQE